MGSDIFAKFSAYIKNPRKEANISKDWGCWTLINHAAAREMLLSAGKSCHGVKVPATCLTEASLGSGGAEEKDKGSSLLPPQG